jgi:hypothetical protein
MKSKFKSKIHFYSLVAVLVAGFGGQAGAQGRSDDSTSTRPPLRANTVRNDLPPASPAGTQCGSVSTEDDRILNRVPCLGNDLGVGRVFSSCPSGVYSAAHGACINPVATGTETICTDGEVQTCNTYATYSVVSTAVFRIGPVATTGEVNSWNCPAGYVFTHLFDNGDAGHLYSCVKS